MFGEVDGLGLLGFEDLVELRAGGAVFHEGVEGLVRERDVQKNSHTGSFRGKKSGRTIPRAGPPFM